MRVLLGSVKVRRFEDLDLELGLLGEKGRGRNNRFFQELSGVGEFSF
jgi:hypothetical protein